MAVNTATKKPSRQRKRRSVAHAPQPSPAILVRACWLDRQADALLSEGNAFQAERLAHRAAQLRGWA